MSRPNLEAEPFAVAKNTSSMAPAEPVAIVGIGCRFPGGANTPESFWKLLCAGTDATSIVPSDRWSVGAFYDPDPAKPGKARVQRGGFLDSIDGFDAQFFGISPREAACLDPQQRLLMEVAWESLEDAGFPPSTLAGSRTGVFIGAFTLDYKSLQFGGRARDLIQAHTATGSVMTMVANRLSYIFDFHGPSVAIDTACSSSLVAVHLACRSLATGESTLALAGGVNAMIDPDFTIAESKGGFLSPDGRSKAFDARANGYARGEGAGVVVLKTLARALADGDPIYAVIRGTAVNQDGHTTGITVPSGPAQEALMREVYGNADVAPASVQYVEAHGTGTPVGDPIEARAIGSVMSEGRPVGEACLIGSVKTNMGHLEAAAGVAGLIKAALCLRHKQIPPHLHFETPNPNIPFEQLQLRVPTVLEAWPVSNGPARAGVNAFGFGGTNAHAVLEEAPLRRSEGVIVPPGRAELVVVSARSPEALVAAARRLGDSADSTLHDVAYSLSRHRDHHPERLALVAGSSEELVQQLDAFIGGESRPGLAVGQAGYDAPRPVFVFGGMGPQWWAMGRQLLEQEPVFRASIERSEAALSKQAPWSLLAELTATEDQSRMEETEVAQPANFAIQVALAELWRSWGVEPAAIVGHSAGEIAAAYVAGALDWDDAVEVIYHRSRLQQLTTGQGKMLAVGLAPQAAHELAARYQGQVSVAAINSPSAVTMVGDAETLKVIAGTLEAAGIFSRFLRVKVPYHSHYLDSLRAEFVSILSHIQPRLPLIPMYSPVTGGRIAHAAFNADFCWRNTRETVRFAEAADALIADGFDTFVEIGPHPVLASALAENLSLRGKAGRIVPSLRRGEPERATLLGSLGALYTAGQPVAWDKLYPTGQLVTLPTYPWQESRYWSEAGDSAQERLGQQIHPLLGQRAESSHMAWELELSTQRLPYLLDHQIQGAALLPGAAYIEMAFAAAQDAFGGETAFSLRDVAFKRALFLPDGANPLVRVFLDADRSRVEIYSRAERSAPSGWTLNASAELHEGQGALEIPAPVALAALRANCPDRVSADRCYEALRLRGFEYGAAFRGIKQMWTGADQALAEIRLPAPMVDDAAAYRLHPALLDAAFQALIASDPAVLGNQAESSPRVYLPVGIKRILFHSRPEGTVFAHARLVMHTPLAMEGDVRLVDEAGNVLVEVIGFRAQALESAPTGTGEPHIRNDVYQVEWHVEPHAEVALDRSDPGAWLIFAGHGRVGSDLAGMLAEHGETCVMVTAGPTFGTTGDGFQIDPANRQHYDRLLTAALPEKPALRGVVHLWSLGTPAGAPAGPADLAVAEQRGAGSVLRLTQALAEAGLQPKLWLATRGAQPVRGDDDAPAFVQAPLWGIGRVIGHQEYLAMRGGLVDLDPEVDVGEAAALFAELWQPDGEDQVALRGDQRYVARLVRQPAPLAVLPPRFRPDGAYLITGGFGALGQLVASWMVERGARRLILAGRTPLAPRAEWSLLKPGTPGATQVSAMRALEARGASVHLATVDVSDEQDFARFLDGYELEAWPPIRGVVHAAGVVRDQILARMDEDSFDEVMRPKVSGSWVLHSMLAEAPLDFFVLFSSVASVLVSTGQANYASANAFLDGLAHFRRAQGLPATSINWGPWAVGMIEKLNLADHYRQRGLDVITADAGMRLLDRLFAQDPAQAVVLAADWPVVFRSYPFIPPMIRELGDDASTAASETDTAEAPLVDRLAAAPAEERAGLLEQHLQDVVARVLRLDRAHVDMQRPLTTLGMDSMLAIEIKNRIEQTIGTAVSVVDLLQGSSISALAARLLPQISALLPAETSVEDLSALVDVTEAAELERLLTEVESSAELVGSGRTR